MLKKELMNELNNENHYTVPKYVLSYAKELGLDMDSLILLIYFLNKPNKSIFDYKKIIEDINFTEKELLNALSTLKDKNILLILMEKNDSGVLEEKVDISLFYEIIFSKILNKETKENNEKDLYDNFEKEFGRTTSPEEIPRESSSNEGRCNESISFSDNICSDGHAETRYRQKQSSVVVSGSTHGELSWRTSMYRRISSGMVI